MYEYHKCVNCENPVHRKTSKYCSKKCQGEWRTKYKIKQGGPKKIKAEFHICPICLKQYSPDKIKQKFCSNTCCSKDIEVRKNRGKSGVKLIGRKHSEEVRLKQSIAATKRMAGVNFTKGVGGIRKDIGHYVRSRWEANIARILLYEKIEYKYEIDSIHLKENLDHTIIYTPDFKIDSFYIEVKGWWDPKSVKKKRLLKEQKPEIDILYIDEEIYVELEKYYKGKINDWEYKQKSRGDRSVQ